MNSSSTLDKRGNGKDDVKGKIGIHIISLIWILHLDQIHILFVRHSGGPDNNPKDIYANAYACMLEVLLESTLFLHQFILF